jgi:hypothetical protein
MKGPSSVVLQNDEPLTWGHLGHFAKYDDEEELWQEMILSQDTREKKGNRKGNRR